MLRAILNKSWRQHPTNQQLYSHLPPITKTIKIRWTRHAGHYWRSRDEFISDVLLRNPSHGRAKAGRPARTYIQQLCADTGYSPEDPPEAMDDRKDWREKVRDIRADRATWWWWWWYKFPDIHSHTLTLWPSVKHPLNFIAYQISKTFGKGRKKESTENQNMWKPNTELNKTNCSIEIVATI